LASGCSGRRANLLEASRQALRPPSPGCRSSARVLSIAVRRLSGLLYQGRRYVLAPPIYRAHVDVVASGARVVTNATPGAHFRHVSDGPHRSPAVLAVQGHRLSVARCSGGATMWRGDGFNWRVVVMPVEGGKELGGKFSPRANMHSCGIIPRSHRSLSQDDARSS
jgi:hypothetical protein